MIIGHGKRFGRRGFCFHKYVPDVFYSPRPVKYVLETRAGFARARSRFVCATSFTIRQVTFCFLLCMKTIMYVHGAWCMVYNRITSR